MKVKVTYRELMMFSINAKNYATKVPETKIAKTLERVIKANSELITGYQEAIEDINLEVALVDLSSDPPKIVYDDIQSGIYAMDKEGKRLQRQKIKELNNRLVDVTFKHLMPSDIPADLGPDFRAVFTPFILEPLAEAVDSD